MSPYYDSEGRCILPANAKLAPWEVGVGKRPSNEFKLLGSADLTAPATSSFYAPEAGPSAPDARSGPGLESAALDTVAHNPGVRADQIQAQVAQLKTMEGVAGRWKAGDTVERTASRFQVYPEAVDRYFSELAGDDKDGKGKRKRTMLKQRSQPAHK